MTERVSLLETVRGPADVKRMDHGQLSRLAAEIREFLVDTVSRTGGHFGPNLGMVELTLALHRVFDSPRDVLLFDVGHQAYVHKIVTGRLAGFAGLRQAGGLSGYPARAESAHDVIENSHASTALSYADGMTKAFQLSGERRHVVAVVGDGALTGGLCWEALNNLAASPRRPVVIVLNDNGRSYAPTAGALAGHLRTLRREPDAPSMFASLGLAYVGPVAGHDLPALERALRRARAFDGPVVVHAVTRKGYGHGPAERDEADRMHQVPPAPGAAAPASGPSWTSVFADELASIGRRRADVVAVTAAMTRSTGLDTFAGADPRRAFDVGIAEQHAITSAAGMAMTGLHPVVALYSTFFNRGFDQLLLDVALHRLPVTLVLDRAGVTGPDGPSHHGMWDLSLLGVVPGVRVAAPRDEPTLRQELRDALATADGPTVVRFPRGTVPAPIPAVRRCASVDVLREPAGHADVLLVGVGALAEVALATADRLADQGIGVTVADPRWILPVPDALAALAAEHPFVCTMEDSGRHGGFGSALATVLRDRSVASTLLDFALPQRFLEHGTRGRLLARAGLTAQEAARRITERVAGHTGLAMEHQCTTESR